jgi:hypothetical protein
MTLRLRSILYLALASVVVLALAACGGSDGAKKGGEADSSTDVNTLLKETFTGDKKVDSGKFDLSMNIDVQGAQGVNGPITVKLGGPFQSLGKGKLPKFKIDLAFSGAGQDIKAGATSTGDKAFVSYKGQEYAVSDQIFKQVKAGFEEAQKKSAEQNSGKSPSLATLGIDPRNWLTNPKNEGDAKVGDADTIKITGGVDVNKLLDDVNTALGKASSLGIQNTGQIPQKLTDEQKKQVTDAVKSLKVEVYTGKDDKILRRMVIDLDAQAPKGTSGGGSAKLKLDISLLDLNQDQDVTAPSNAKPFEELIGQLGALGGALGGAGAGGGASGSSGSGAADQKKLEDYTKCITDAGSDAAKAQKCAEILTP